MALAVWWLCGGVVVMARLGSGGNDNCDVGLSMLLVGTIPWHNVGVLMLQWWQWHVCGNCRGLDKSCGAVMLTCGVGIGMYVLWRLAIVVLGDIEWLWRYSVVIALSYAGVAVVVFWGSRGVNNANVVV